eukprot:13358878-Alexandrium_andersonii.AAC.1
MTGHAGAMEPGTSRSLFLPQLGRSPRVRAAFGRTPMPRAGPRLRAVLRARSQAEPPRAGQ